MKKNQETMYKQELYQYSAGFLGALVLVYLVYFATIGGWFGREGLAVFIIVLALMQLVLQLFVFLHIGRKSERMTLWSVAYGFVMLLIVVGGSIWIMANMNYNMHMTPEQMHEFMLEQNKKGF